MDSGKLSLNFIYFVLEMSANVWALNVLLGSGNGERSRVKGREELVRIG